MSTKIPVVIEQGTDGERVYDIFSRLLKERIVFLNGPVTTESSHSIVAQLMLLDAEDSSKPISLYINSPGGEVTAGMAILDTMKHIKAPVHTVCIGMAASMGALLLATGDKRFAHPNSEIMIHQPLGGARGQATDIDIEAKWILKTKEKLEAILAKATGQPISKIKEDTDRNFWMTADEARKYGLVDEVVKPAPKK